MISVAYRCIELLRDLLIAFCLSLSKIKINAHQQIAYWRSRIREAEICRNILAKKRTTNEDSSQNNIELKVNILDHSPESRQYSNSASECKQSGPNKPDILSKTPRIHKTKLTSLFRRLSLRNFMDYCVAALNEASSSSCSNRFDLSACIATVWLLGRRYDLPQQGDQLIDDIRSRFWITYRRNFPPIDENTRYTTDRGFGCMIRCGQMVLANALLCKNLSRDWRWSAQSLEANPQIYAKILKLFQDREDCPYSIHRIVEIGQKYEGKKIGEWFGPNTIAQALKKLSSSYQQEKTFDQELTISIDAALDNIVVIDEIKKKFKRNENVSNDGSNTEDSWIPGILFIQLRLGLTKINPIYFAALKKTFQFNNSLGIIGGRPNHALYLIGYTDDDIIYLDPHNTQQYIDLDETATIATLAEPESSSPTPKAQSDFYAQFVDLSDCSRTNNINGNQSGPSTTYQRTPDETYHCSCPEKMPIDRLDPSLALCFYFSDESEFENWCTSSQELLVKLEQAPMFEITNSRPCDWSRSLVSTTSRTVTNAVNSSSASSSPDQEEEFEILS